MHSHNETQLQAVLDKYFHFEWSIKKLSLTVSVFFGYIKELPHHSTFKKPYLFKKH